MNIQQVKNSLLWTVHRCIIDLKLCLICTSDHGIVMHVELYPGYWNDELICYVFYKINILIAPILFIVDHTIPFHYSTTLFHCMIPFLTSITKYFSCIWIEVRCASCAFLSKEVYEQSLLPTELTCRNLVGSQKEENIDSLNFSFYSNKLVIVTSEEI